MTDIDIKHLDLSQPQTWTDGERAQVKKNTMRLIEMIVDFTGDNGNWRPDSELDGAGREIKRRALSIIGMTNKEYDELLASGQLEEEDCDADA